MSESDEKFVPRSDRVPSLKREMEFAVREERERAARMVEEEILRDERYLGGGGKYEVYRDEVLALVQRIRHGSSERVSDIATIFRE